ncbi:hypothetical protein Aduo_014058 [Ancylostoma duodenale]
MMEILYSRFSEMTPANGSGAVAVRPWLTERVELPFFFFVPPIHDLTDVNVAGQASSIVLNLCWCKVINSLRDTVTIAVAQPRACGLQPALFPQPDCLYTKAS